MSPRSSYPVPGRNRGGIFLKLLVLLAVLFAIGALAWMLFLPVLFTTQLRERTGGDVTLRSLMVNPFTGTIELHGLVLANPTGFPEHDFLQLREFRLKADVASLLSDRPVFDDVALDVAKVTLAKTAAGRTNTEALPQGLGASEPGAPAPVAARPAPRFLIRRLTLRFDQLVIADHSGAFPVVREVALGLNRTFTNVTDLKSQLPAEAWQGLAPIGAAASGLVPSDLGQAWHDAAKQAAKEGAERFKQARQKTGEKVKGLIEALEENKKP